MKRPTPYDEGDNPGNGWRKPDLIEPKRNWDTERKYQDQRAMIKRDERRNQRGGQ